MSYISPELTAFKDGPALDAFGRLRSSGIVTLFAYQPGPSQSALYFDNHLAGTGTYTFTANASVLSTGGSASGARAMRQTKVYWRYHPGKSLLCRFATRFGTGNAPTGAAVARKGYYDDNNGAFFGRDANGYFVGYRSDVSGSVVETRIHQMDWNVDTGSPAGLNPSGVTLDFNRVLLMGIDFLAAGTGRIRFYLVMDGKHQIVHQLALGTDSTDYLRTLNLPLRAEVANEDGTGANITLQDFSMVVDVEDGGDTGDGGYTISCGTKGVPSATLANSTTMVPIMTVRLRDTFNGETYRGHAHPTNLDLLCFSNDIYWELRWNCTLTGASFSLVDTDNSGLELDTAATAASGGTVIYAGYAKGGSKQAAELSTSGHFQSYIMSRTYANVRDTLTLVARGIGGNATAHATMSFEEQY